MEGRVGAIKLDISKVYNRVEFLKGDFTENWV